MTYKNYFNFLKEYVFKYLKKIDDTKVYLYLYFFIFYFIFFYIITIPETVSPRTNSYIKNILEEHKLLGILIIIFINFIYISSIFFLAYKYKNTNQFKAILIPITLSGIILFIDVLLFSKYLSYISNWKLLKVVFLLFSSIFFIIFLCLFFYNINIPLNIEFCISLLILSIFMFVNIYKTYNNLNNVYNLLFNNNYNLLSINCLNQNNIENYDDNNNNINFNQIDSINSEYGNNYLKTLGNIPIAFYNKNINEYQDLILSDFYYPGSYYSYLANSPLNGTPNLDALVIVLQKFKCRIIHLDIFSDSNDPYDPNANPVVRCANMKSGSEALNLDDVFGTINKWAWVNNNPNNLSYPLFLYLNFNFDETNENIYFKIYNSLIKFFSKYFVDKKYSFSGRNSTFSISQAPIIECLGKIIIITNTYPTKTVLDELINCSDNSLNNYFNLLEYKQSYITYDSVGMSQDNDKNKLLLDSKTNISFYYSEPNDSYKNNNQSKAGLFNPSFQDCAQYGIQGTLMYIFIPDDNLNKWNLFFKNKNNLDPVLKNESLRNVKTQNNQTIQNDPIIGLQKPQKYCLAPSMSTQK
jgi:hypothetical protein